MTMPELACGTRAMLDIAIDSHRSTHDGELPRRIELHPALLPELLRVIGPLVDQRQPGPLRYRGVVIVITMAASEPRMVTSRFVTEYL